MNTLWLLSHILRKLIRFKNELVIQKMNIIVYVTQIVHTLTQCAHIAKGLY